MDMPVPAVAAWEWLNWKFPRAAHAGDTIYARWTLTQKRAPVGGSPTAIVVWRVDVHTSDGTLCAEGEVGASVMRKVGTARPRVPEPTAVAGSTAITPRRGRRRRRTPGGDGAKSASDTKASVAVEPPVVPAPAVTAAGERPASGPRRRRRRRPSGAAQARNGDAPAGAAPVEAPSPPPVVKAAAAQETANPLTRAIRRLRRP
jgi:hypothetical protein